MIREAQLLRYFEGLYFWRMWKIKLHHAVLHNFEETDSDRLVSAGMVICKFKSIVTFSWDSI